MSTVTERLARERFIKSQAERCVADGEHGRGYWWFGDYATPDRYVCERCGATLEERPHRPKEA